MLSSPCLPLRGSLSSSTSSSSAFLSTAFGIWITRTGHVPINRPGSITGSPFCVRCRSLHTLSHKKPSLTSIPPTTVNIFSDVIIICLPISQVLRIRMPFKQKLGVMSIFLLGILVVITSIIRAIFAWQNKQMITCTVSMIETAIAIIANSLPVLRTLFFGSKSRSGTYYNNSSRAYELSHSNGPAKQGPLNKVTASVASNVVTDGHGTPTGLSRHDSEDELVKDAACPPVDDHAGISVTTEYHVFHGRYSSPSVNGR
ncbi:unnamed protein product [Aspergillus oryzae RIB40]|uniref:DNA, SC009 n=1 Tax=Aspergillus oryzae (strain ATCC 42149 / RIB 40) TaxID=510516 RepID=Q2UTY2_ASPOR|nr:unnamed protein product [Aspergillus oryzae RIB40]BAE54983.1 unnamed protein product [Aspergillus oryzae RIB40]